MTLSLSKTKWAEHEKQWQLRLSNIRNRNNKLALERRVSSSLFDEYIKEESSSSSRRKPLKKRRLVVRTIVADATHVHVRHHYLYTKKDKNTRATTTSILQNCSTRLPTQSSSSISLSKQTPNHDDNACLFFDSIDMSAFFNIDVSKFESERDSKMKSHKPRTANTWTEVCLRTLFDDDDC